MTRDQMIEAFQYVEDAYLDLADPQSPKEIMKEMKNRKMKTLLRIAAAAALVAALAVTAYAANAMQVKSLTGKTDKIYNAYDEIQSAMDRAGYRIAVKEQFASGFTFQRIRVDDTYGLDENEQQVLSVKDICVFYENENHILLMLHANRGMEEIPESPHAPGINREISGVPVSYYVDHYRFVPEDYVPTEEDTLWLQQPGNNLSYGADDITETTVSFLSWTMDGIQYFFMDNHSRVDPDTLFAMAEELIRTPVSG